MAYREIINAATDFYTSRNQKKKDEEQHGGSAAQWALNRTGGGRSNATAASSNGGQTASYREPEVAEEYADDGAGEPGRYGETAKQQPKMPRLPGALGRQTRERQAAVSPEKFAREQKNRMQAAADAYGSTTQRLRVENALRKGDYAQASRLLDEMTGEGTPRAQRQQTADYINSLYDDPSRWNGNKTANRREAWRNTDAYMEELQGLDLNQFSDQTRAGAERLLDAYDRDPRQLADLLESEEGAAILEAIERERGGQHEDDAQAAAWENLRNSRERYLTQNANYDFFQRGQEQIDRAAQSETGRAQMDSYLRAHGATLALNDLYNYLDVGGNAEAGGGHGLNTYSAQYLLDELAGYGVDLRGMDESNFRQAVEQAMQEQGQRARVMGAALRQAGYDPEAVERVLEYTRNNQQNQARRESTQQAVDNAGLLDRAALHLASTAENVWLSPLENIATWAQLGAGRGNVNQPGSYVPVASMPTNASLVRGAIADTMTPTGAFFYNALSSAADSFLNVSSFGGAGSLASMGASAATQEANDILARGGSNRQAVTGGLAAGAIEVLTEIVSVENLINIRNNPGSIRDMLKSVGVQMFTEGSEEINSEVLGLIVDGLNMGNLSETSQAVQQYTAQGMSYEEAKRRVLLDNVKQVAMSGLAGAVSGGMSAGATAIGTSIGNSLAQRAAQRQAMADYGTEMEQLYRQEAARRQAAQSDMDAGGGANVPAGMIAPYETDGVTDGPGNQTAAEEIAGGSPALQEGGQIARATSGTENRSAAEAAEGRGVEDAAPYENNRNQQNAVGAAAREGVDFSPAAQTLSEAVDRYGAHPEGSVHSDTRSVEIPTQLDDDTHVSRAARTFAEAQSVDNSFVSRVVEPAIANGEFNITPDGNERQLRAGREWVDQHTGTQPITDAVQDWRRAVAQGERGMNRTALQAAGFTLLTRLANGTRTEMSPETRQQYDRAAVEVMTTLQGAVSESARLLQMQHLLQRMSPEMQVYSARTAISQLEAALGERGIRNADGRLHVNDQLLENFRSALESNDEQRISEARAALYRDIASQTRATIQDKLNAWRYLCMLGNPRTIIRNLIGNVVFGPMVTVSNRVQAGLQALFTPEEQRTKSLQPALFTTERGRQAMDFARNDYQNVEDELKGEGKFGRNGGGISGAARELQNVIREYHAQLRIPGIRQWQQATEWGLNSDAIGDGRFLRGYYTRALAQTIVARGYNVETRGNTTYLTDKNGNRVAQRTFEDMQADAIRQAQRATYRDANAVTNLMKKLRPKGNSRAAQVGRLLVDANLPFVSTPTNIMMRMAEFGPVGLLYTIGNETRRLRNGDISQTEYFEKLSNGLTGSAVFALGMLLSSLGIVRGGRPDDKDEREGVGRYTLNIGDKSISLDWLAPAAPILLSGATLNEALNAEHKSAIDAVFSTAGAYFEPLLEASYLSGLQNLVESMGYTEDKGANALYASTIGSIMSYLSQYIPTLAGQAAATARDEITDTYTGDMEGALSKQFTRSVASIGKKLGLDQMGVDIRQQPRLDDWGRETDAGSTGERALNNFVNPASASQVRRTDVDAEIERLEQATGETGLAPSRRGYTVTVNKEQVRLNGDQYTDYQRTYGQTAFSLIEEMMKSPAYRKASDEEKAEMVKKCYDIADERAKVAAGVGYKSEDKLVGLMDKGLSVADAYAAKSYHDALNDYGKDEGGGRAVLPAGAENLTGPAQWAVAGLGGGTAAQESTPEPYTKNEKAARFKNWVQGQSWTEAQKQAVLDAYGTYTSMTFSDTEKFDKLERFGLSGDDSTRIMEAIGDLEPIGDAAQVSDVQKWGAIVNDERLSDEQKIAAMWGYMSDDQQARFEIALQGGISASQYLEVYEAKKTHGNKNGNWTNETLKAYLKAGNYSENEKHWLFDAFKPNKKTANPYASSGAVEHWTPPAEDEEPTAAEDDGADELTGAARWALAMGGG